MNDHRPTDIHVIRAAACLVVAAAISFSGCFVDPEQSETGLAPLNLTVTIDASVAYLFQGAGHVFASDTDGTLLALAAWDGEGEVVLAGPDDTAYGSIMVTLVSRGATVMETWQGVAPNGRWTRPRTEVAQPLGQTTVRLENIPEHAGCLVSTAAFHVYRLALAEQYSLPLNGEPGAMYLRLATLDGTPRGVLVNNLMVDDTVTLDLARPDLLVDLTPRTMSLGELAPGESVGWRLFWMDGGDDIARHGIWLDNDDGLTTSAVQAHLPAGLWASEQLLTYLSFRRGGVAIQETFRGDWPETAVRASDQVTVTVNDDGSVTYRWDGPAHDNRTEWLSQTGAQAGWTMHGRGEGATTVALPTLSPTVAAENPDGTPGAFAMWRVRVAADLGAGRTFVGSWMLED